MFSCYGEDVIKFINMKWTSWFASHPLQITLFSLPWSWTLNYRVCISWKRKQLKKKQYLKDIWEFFFQIMHDTFTTCCRWVLFYFSFVQQYQMIFHFWNTSMCLFCTLHRITLSYSFTLLYCSDIQCISFCINIIGAILFWFLL